MSYNDRKGRERKNKWKRRDNGERKGNERLWEEASRPPYSQLPLP